MTEQGIVVENHAAGCTFWVWVKPRAARSGVAGVREGALVLRVDAPPAEGEANRKAVRLLSKILQVPQRNIELASGHGSRRKRIIVHGLDAATVAGRLQAAMS